MTKLFESNWKNTVAALCEGRDLVTNFDGSANTTKKKMMETIFNNTHREMKLMEAALAGSSGASSIATLNKVILPVLRRVMPTTIATEIVGVQPMSSPVSQIHTIRVRYADTFGGVTAGSEALNPFDIARGYTGNGSVNAPRAMSTAAGEGFGGNRLSIQVLKETVEAKTRRIGATWTIEGAQDANSQHGIDLEAEILAALAQEVTAEIDQEILYSLRALPGSPTITFDMNTLSGTPGYVGEMHAVLAILINKQANVIGARTRRGSGNWAVVSPNALTILQSGSTSALARTTEGVFEAPTNTKFVGVLNNAQRIYVDQYANDTTPVLIGYKGNEADAAAYYCPYVPLMSSGTVMDPYTFQPTVSFMTRYGYKELTNTASSLGNSADYVSLIGMANLTFM